MAENDKNRRLFLKGTAAASLGLLGVSKTEGQQPTTLPDPARTEPDEQQKKKQEHYRYHPGPGGPVGSAEDRGKLIPGLRPAGLAPVEVTTPDIPKLPWKMVDGAKEFHLRPMQVRREFLPGYEMVVWGYNGSLPGPTIEATEGDRVRIIVHNELPEPTSAHWHSLELPIHMDGVPGLVQSLIPPGKSKVYEFDLHQNGTFFYHSHVAMQEGMGQAGFFIVHPKIAYEPVVDRDFALMFQNFFIPPNQTIADSQKMDWNWHTINGRSGPFTTPLVCKHGERVRVRLVNFSPMQHHPIHLHGHTFWQTGTEGGRIPDSAWRPMNNTLVGVAQASDFEFIANNPGDWIFHCHMVHHMMNHMVSQVGPRIRPGSDVADFQSNLDSRPPVRSALDTPPFQVPGYPQLMVGMEGMKDMKNMKGMPDMKGMSMSKETMMKLWDRREVKGMRPDWPMGVHGLMTVLRVLPEDLYVKVMESKDEIPKGAIYDEIVKRMGKYFSNPKIE